MGQRRPSSRQEKARGKSVSKTETQTPVAEKPRDKYSTQAIATALLDPTVSEMEEAEYQGSILPSLLIHRHVTQIISLHIGTSTNIKSSSMLQLRWGRERTLKYMLWQCKRQRARVETIGKRTSHATSLRMWNAAPTAILMELR